MPRTKQVRKKSSMKQRGKESSLLGAKLCKTTDGITSLVCKDYKSVEDLIKSINAFFDDAINCQKQSYENACKMVSKVHKESLQGIPVTVQKLNINATYDGSLLLDGNQNKDSKIKVSSPQSATESFEFKIPKAPSQPIGRSSRTSSKTSVEIFKTPVMKSRRPMSGSVITPKLQSHTPMTVYRRPQMGEMAISMSGSPLLVRPFAGDDVPTVNVPLQDGRVFSIMPEDGAPIMDLPFDEVTKKHLRTLRAHLEILASSR